MSSRPTSLQAVADRSGSLDEFGRNLRDWLHELRRASSRPQAAAMIAAEPARLKGRFAGGDLADAWLAAYAEHLAGKAGRAAPAWAFGPGRIARDPAFAEGLDSAGLRALALAHAPAAFKRRNLFTPAVDLPVRWRAGRPPKTVEEKRRTNAERQRRFRLARREELAALRKLVREQVRSRKQGAAKRHKKGD